MCGIVGYGEDSTLRSIMCALFAFENYDGVLQKEGLCFLRHRSRSQIEFEFAGSFFLTEFFACNMHQVFFPYPKHTRSCTLKHAATRTLDNKLHIAHFVCNLIINGRTKPRQACFTRTKMLKLFS